MRHQHDKPREEQQAQDAEFHIGTTLQEFVPSVQVLCDRHHRNEQCSEDEHGAAAKYASCAQTSGPFSVLAASIKTAAQNCTT